MYVDDEVPGFEVGVGDDFHGARDRELEPMMQAGALGEEPRNRNRGQRVYVEEPDFEAPPVPPPPRVDNQAPGPIPVRDYEEVRREASEHNQHAQAEYPQPPLRSHPTWPVPYRIPLRALGGMLALGADL